MHARAFHEAPMHGHLRVVFIQPAEVASVYLLAILQIQYSALDAYTRMHVRCMDSNRRTP